MPTQLGYSMTLPQPDSASSARKPLFEASTQFRNWRFSPEQLHQTRTELTEAAVAVIRNSFEVYEVRAQCSASDATAKSIQARVVSQCSLSERRRRVPACAALFVQNTSAMCTLSFPGGSG